MPTQTPELQAFATGFPVTLLHVAVTMLILLAGAGLYILMTPHKEIALIREGNAAAGTSLAAVLAGLAIPLAVSMHASATVVEVALWGVSTVMVQLLIFRLADLVLHNLPKRIQDGEIAAAIALAGVKIATALILAAAVAG